MKAEVVELEQIAANVQQIKIVPLQGSLPFTVGSHIDISVLIIELPEIRSYSLIGEYRKNEPIPLR